MRLGAFAAMILAPVLARDPKKDILEACDRMDRVPSYHFSVKIVQGGKEKGSFEGEVFSQGVFHVRSEKGESLRAGDRRFLKARDGEWKEVPVRSRGGETPEVNHPHDWARKVAAQCPVLKKEKSSRIGPVTVDIYVCSLRHDAARKSLEAGGMPLWANAADWTKTENGVLFYLGRDNLLYRLEQRFDGRSTDDQKIDNFISIEFSDFGKARCRLPDDLKEKIGLKGR